MYKVFWWWSTSLIMWTWIRVIQYWHEKWGLNFDGQRQADSQIATTHSNLIGHISTHSIFFNEYMQHETLLFVQDPNTRIINHDIFKALKTRNTTTITWHGTWTNTYSIVHRSSYYERKYNCILDSYHKYNFTWIKTQLYITFFNVSHTQLFRNSRIVALKP